MPAPGVGDDGAKVGALRRPSQPFTGFFRVGYQCWRIPRPPRRVAGNDLASANASHHINHLTDRCAVTGTKVDGDGVAAVEQILERQYMRAGEIGHMNVVTYGSVG